MPTDGRRDRRARVVPRHEIVFERLRFRGQLRALENALDELDRSERERVRVLVGQLMAGWLASEGVFGSLDVAVVVLTSGIRVDVTVEPDMQGYVAWDRLVAPHIRDLVIDWGVDRRSPASAWFGIESGSREMTVEV